MSFWGREMRFVFCFKGFALICIANTQVGVSRHTKIGDPREFGIFWIADTKIEVSRGFGIFGDCRHQDWGHPDWGSPGIRDFWGFGTLRLGIPGNLGFFGDCGHLDWGIPGDLEFLGILGDGWIFVSNPGSFDLGRQ